MPGEQLPLQPAPRAVKKKKKKWSFQEVMTLQTQISIQSSTNLQFFFFLEGMKN